MAGVAKQLQQTVKCAAFEQVEDAVISDASSFAYSAFAATRRIPVTVWNDDGSLDEKSFAMSEHFAV
jgi:hypothetical protein